jgi:hypothetical protein
MSEKRDVVALRSLVESCLMVLRTLRDDPAVVSGKVKLCSDVVEFVNVAEAAYREIG